MQRRAKHRSPTKRIQPKAPLAKVTEPKRAQWAMQRGGGINRNEPCAGRCRATIEVAESVAGEDCSFYFLFSNMHRPIRVFLRKRRKTGTSSTKSRSEVIRSLPWYDEEGAPRRRIGLHPSRLDSYLLHWEIPSFTHTPMTNTAGQGGGRERRLWRMKRPGSPMRQGGLPAVAWQDDYAELWKHPCSEVWNPNRVPCSWRKTRSGRATQT